MDSLERTAYHESGHAVVAIALGLNVTSVTIERAVTIDRDGWDAYAGRTHVDLREPVAAAIVCLAGPAASRRLSPGDNQIGMDGDFLSADKAIDDATGDYRSFPNLSSYAYRRADISLQVRATAERIVEYHWPEIVGFVHTLLARKTIAGDAAVQLFNLSLSTRGLRVWGRLPE